VWAGVVRWRGRRALQRGRPSQTDHHHGIIFQNPIILPRNLWFRFILGKSANFNQWLNFSIVAYWFVPKRSKRLPVVYIGRSSRWAGAILSENHSQLRHMWRASPTAYSTVGKLSYRWSAPTWASSILHSILSVSIDTAPVLSLHSKIGTLFQQKRFSWQWARSPCLNRMVAIKAAWGICSMDMFGHTWGAFCKFWGHWLISFGQT
jgi:hypothetical protein